MVAPACTVTVAGTVAAVGAGVKHLAPGDAVGVALLSGDFSIGATGTVTHVDGDKVYAASTVLAQLA